MEAGDDIDARAVNSIDLGRGVTLRVGRYGPYMERGETKANRPEDLVPDDLTLEKAEEILAEIVGAERVVPGRTLELGREVFVVDEAVDWLTAHPERVQFIVRTRAPWWSPC